MIDWFLVKNMDNETYVKVWKSIYTVVQYIHRYTHGNLRLFYYVAMQLSHMHRLDYRKYMRIEFSFESEHKTVHVEAQSATYASLSELTALAKSQRIVICTAPWMYDLSCRMNIVTPCFTDHQTINRIPDIMIQFFNSLVPHYDYYLLISYVIPIFLAPHEASVAETLSNMKNIGCVKSNLKSVSCSESGLPRKLKTKEHSKHHHKSTPRVFVPNVNEKSTMSVTIGVKKTQLLTPPKTFRIIEYNHKIPKMNISNLILPAIIITPPVPRVILPEAKICTMVR